MTPPEGTNAKPEGTNTHLMKAHKAVLTAIKDLTDDEQDRVLDATKKLLGYARPVMFGEEHE